MVNTVRYLADVSTFGRYRVPEVAAILEPLMTGGQLATCSHLELQILGSIRNAVDYSNLARYRPAALVWVPTDDHDLHRALDIQAALAAHREHSVPWPKLLTAAIAERHELLLLHDDPGFEVIARVTGQPIQSVHAPAEVLR